MKSIKYSLLVFGVILIVGFTSFGILGDDSKSATEPIGGDPTPMGTVGNTYSFFSPPGLYEHTIEVIAADGAIGTVQVTGKVSNQKMLNLVKESLPYQSAYQVNGNQVTGTVKFRKTTKGIQTYMADGRPFTLVEYGAKVGDIYTFKRDGLTLVRKVTHKSTDDDYPWGFMMIKVIKVEETGHNTPGISKVVYITNHKFGIVGIDVHFEDGSETNLLGFSDLYND